MSIVFALCLLVARTEIEIAMAMAASLQSESQVQAVCNCDSCGPTCKCAASGDCDLSNAWWKSTPNGQYGLYVGTKQIGVWNGEGYWPIEGSQWGKRQGTTPIPLPAQRVSAQANYTAYQPAQVPYYSFAQPVQMQNYQPSPSYGFPSYAGFAVPQTPTCVGGQCGRR